MKCIEEMIEKARKEYFERIEPDPKRRAVLRMHSDLVNLQITHRMINGCDMTEEMLMAKFRGCAS